MTQAFKKNKFSLATIFFTFFIDSLSLNIVFPVFAPLFLDPVDGLITHTNSFAFKVAVMGIFLGIFPLMQLFFCPLIGTYADRHGRRDVLVFTTALTFLGYMISCFGIHYGSLPWIFISRVVMGIGAANLSICLSALSDLSLTHKEKGSHYALCSLIACFALILGGRLSYLMHDSTISSSLPMLIGGGLGLLNICFIFFFFKETLLYLPGTPPLRKSIHFSLKKDSLFWYYSFYFCLLSAWHIIFLFIPPFVVNTLSVNPKNIGGVSTIIGICWIFGSGVLYRIAVNYIEEKRILCVGSIILAVMIPFMGHAKNIFNLALLLGSASAMVGMLWPICTGAISKRASCEMQAETLGISQALLSLSIMICCFVSGFFLHIHSNIPFVVASVFAVLAILSLIKWQSHPEGTI